jgi:hypothetical protein
MKSYISLRLHVLRASCNFRASSGQAQISQSLENSLVVKHWFNGSVIFPSCVPAWLNTKTIAFIEQSRSTYLYAGVNRGCIEIQFSESLRKFETVGIMHHML